MCISIAMNKIYLLIDSVITCTSGEHHLAISRGLMHRRQAVEVTVCRLLSMWILVELVVCELYSRRGGHSRGIMSTDGAISTILPPKVVSIR